MIKHNTIELTSENIKKGLESSVNLLAEFSIIGLSFLELASLRQFVLDSIKDYNLHAVEGRNPFGMPVNPESEAADRWLYFTYGLRLNDCHDKFSVISSNGEIIYNGYHKTEAVKLFRENFPKFDIIPYQSTEMTEYIRRMRGEDHLI